MMAIEEMNIGAEGRKDLRVLGQRFVEGRRAALHAAQNDEVRQSAPTRRLTAVPVSNGLSRALHEGRGHEVPPIPSTPFTSYCRVRNRRRSKGRRNTAETSL